jgi:hypothetical protein
MSGPRGFGWDLPPGVSMSDIDPPEQPCEVCGIEAGNCICPECPQCGSYGDPHCYEKHGLVRTPEQIDSRAAYETARERDRRVEPDYGDDDPEQFMRLRQPGFGTEPGIYW